MIHIKRPKQPTFLKDKEGKWVKETEKAIKHYSEQYTKAFEFKMYNDPQLKNELKKVFVKCAYCESSYGAVYDGDVEHFRPKGKVNEKNPQTPGYYWLANDWDNLFLSCQHCNQRRKHDLFGEEKLKTNGKLDQFPIKEEQKRVTKHNLNINKEETFRLLLNPCKDDPSIHIEYEDKECVIVPITEMGKKSVEVLVLQRRPLVMERKKQMLLLFTQMQRVKRELERLNNDNSKKQMDEFDFELDELLKYTQPDAVYAGMSRFFVTKFLDENNLR